MKKQPIMKIIIILIKVIEILLIDNLKVLIKKFLK